MVLMVLIPTGGVLGGKREDGREGALGSIPGDFRMWFPNWKAVRSIMERVQFSDFLSGRPGKGFLPWLTGASK